MDYGCMSVDVGNLGELQFLYDMRFFKFVFILKYIKNIKILIKYILYYNKSFMRKLL
jgi:hypothetical protein